MKNLPSPTSYKAKLMKTQIGGRMAIRLPSDVDIKIKNNKMPGPGAYNLD